MFKKITVLAMALGVVAALALPTSASANWKHHEIPIQEDVQLGLTGQVSFNGRLGGIDCQITSRVKFTAGTTTGHAETFAPDPVGQPQPATETNRCNGTGGLQFCQIHELTPQAPNWTLHTQAWQTTQLVNHANLQQTILAGTTFQNAAVVITKTIHSQVTGAFCPVKTISLAAGGSGLVEHNGGADGNTVSELEVNGALVATLQTYNGVVHAELMQIGGTLEIEDPFHRNTLSF